MSYKRINIISNAIFTGNVGIAHGVYKNGLSPFRNGVQI